MNSRFSKPLSKGFSLPKGFCKGAVDIMKKRLAFLTILSALSILTPVYAVEVAPRISDREIIESLAEGVDCFNRNLYPLLGHRSNSPLVFQGARCRRQCRAVLV